MSANDDIAKLLAGHRHGDLDAFAGLVGQAERTWWPMAAAVAGSQRQMESLVRCCVVAMRRDLERCPVDPAAFHAWARTMARDQGLDLLERAARPASEGEDDLSRLAAAAGLEDLREDGVEVVDGALSVAGQLGDLAGPDRALIAQRYRQGRRLESLAQESGQDAGALAQELCRLRYTLDWRPDASPEALVGNVDFARTVEEAIADAIGTTLRQRLLSVHINGDEQVIALVVRQVRLHLVLEATCRPADADRSRRLAATVAFSPEAAFPDSDRALPAVARQLSQQISIRPGGVKRRRPVDDRLAALRSRSGAPRSAVPRVQASTLARPLPPSRSATDRGGAAPASTADVGHSSRLSRMLATYNRGERTTGLLLWGAVAIMAVITWSVIARTAPSTVAPPAAVAAPSVAVQVQVQRITGSAEVVDDDGRRHPVVRGAFLLPSQRLEAQDPQARVELHVTGLGTIEAVGSTALAFLDAEGEATQVTLARLDQGTLRIAAAGAGDGHVLMVSTGFGRLSGTRFEGEVRIDAEGMAVVATDGWGRLSGVTDVREAVVIPGCRARVGPGRRAMVEGGRRFVRGVALGIDPPADVLVDGNRWTGLRAAQDQGLSFLGRSVKGTPPDAEAALDAEARRMLGDGIIGTVVEPGQVTIVQELPEGLYEIELWLAGDRPLNTQDLRVVIDGRPVPTGLPLAGGLCWRRLGPFPAWQRTRAIELRVLGLVEGSRLAGIAFTRVEPAPPP